MALGIAEACALRKDFGCSAGDWIQSIVATVLDVVSYPLKALPSDNQFVAAASGERLRQPKDLRLFPVNDFGRAEKGVHLEHRKLSPLKAKQGAEECVVLARVPMPRQQYLLVFPSADYFCSWRINDSCGFAVQVEHPITFRLASP